MVKRYFQRASALIITLLLIALVTILIVGYLTTMRTEIVMSNAHLERIKAEHFAHIGTDTARARLLIATSGTNILWTSASGILSVAGTNIELHSGTTASTDSADTLDLNIPSPEDQTKRAIASASFFSDPTNPSMRVQWLYVDKTGTFGTAHSSNSIGRFAFWVDDESAKVNLNTAWKRGNSNPNGHPSQVDLAAIGIGYTDVDTIYSNRPFNTVQEARRVTGTSVISDSNSFQLTAYNHSPELNMFNEPRIILTTQQSLVGSSTNYLDILSTANSDPGLISNLDANKVSTQVNKIAALLRRTNWPLPYLSGKNFANKYSPIDPCQIAINIIEYVRCCESPTALVEPIRGTVSSGTFTYNSTPAYSNAVAGNVRGIRLTEFGIYVSPTPVRTNSDGSPIYLVKLKIEAHLPSGFGLSGVDLSTVRFTPIIMSPTTLPNTFMLIVPSQYAVAVPQSPPSTLRWLSTPWVESGSTNLAAGGYAIVNTVTNFDAKPIATTSGTLTGRSAVDVESVRLAIYDANGVRLELTPTMTQPIPYTVDAASVVETAITTRSVDDPSVNKNLPDWGAQKANSLGRVNANTLGSSSHTVPQQDTDSNNLITDVGMHFPPPKGQQGNVNGVITSVAELGYVHTGIQTLVTTGSGTPWRTIRLQPQTGATTLPDWALLDLFQAPPQPPISFSDNPFSATTSGSTVAITGSDGSTGGKINLNSKVAPFDSALQRTLPLQAVFQNASNGYVKVTAADAATLVTNIVQTKLAASGNFYGLTNYISPGQIAEVSRIADTGELSENLLRDTVDHLTTRGGVYSIYTVGQSIRQNPNGAISVLGEQRYVTVVERIQGSGTVHLRTVYSKSINP
jgi:hypothetical protein